ncbi:hypothetical protein F5Y17DRAFT_461757 [Xylariaceae sp. FL0594]|nr:hypothetical protein F5Y17DRAFT_461757 [Xylariaceae sp. FL0594]
MDVGVRQGGFRDTSLKPAPKRIIICSDGTWQSSTTTQDNVPSNVTRIARYLAKMGRDEQGKEWQQLVYYDAGIGTGVHEIEAKRQGLTGSGFVGNVIEAYNFIVLNYNPGDKIFCFGFSRGAYTARAVAGLVTDIGIIQPRDMQDFPKLYMTYQGHKHSHTFRKSQKWREWVEGVRAFDPAQKGAPAGWQQSPYQWKERPHGEASESTRWVEAVGVFDTVGSLGVPKTEGWGSWLLNIAGRQVPAEEFGFHNVELSPYIKHAYHAMALDEHRKPFDTTMWHYPQSDGTGKPKHPVEELKARWEKVRDTDGASEQTLNQAWVDLVEAKMHEELKGADSELVQVWFPGYHINIGGGSDDLLKKKEGDFEQISMITLAWMVEQLRPHLAFEINVTNFWDQDRFLIMRPHVETLLSKSEHKNHWLVKKIDKLLALEPKADPWNDDNKTRRSVLAADALRGWAVGPLPDSMTPDFERAGSQYRSPGEYKVKDKVTGKDVPLGWERTHEYIHPCVQYRMEHLGKVGKEGYTPIPLAAFDRQPRHDADGTTGYDWVKKNVKIPEWKISESSYERYCIVSGSAKRFVGGLDKGYKIDSWLAKELDEPAQPPSGGPQNQGYKPGGSGF